MSTTLPLFALTALVFAALTALGIAIALPWLRRRAAALDPARRARRISALAAAPLTFGLGLASLCFLSDIIGGLWLAVDHCMGHGHAAPHLCFVHEAESLPMSLAWLFLTGIAAAIVVATLRTAWRMLRLGVSLRALRRASTWDDRLAAWVVDADRPFAIATGSAQGVMLSKGLTTSLSTPLLDAVLAHERAHTQRRDPRRQRLARLLSVLHLPRARRQLLADLELACEQACDEDAAAVVGDRLRVAEALVAVERLNAATFPAAAPIGAPAFGGSAVGHRVAALLGPPADAPGPRRQRWAKALVYGGLAVALSDPLHHATEAVVGWLIGA